MICALPAFPMFVAINVYLRKWKTACILLIVLHSTRALSVLNVQGDAQNMELFLLFFSVTSIIKWQSILAEPYAYYNRNCFHIIIFRVFLYVLRYLSCVQNYLFCKNINSWDTTVFIITILIESKAP